MLGSISFLSAIGASVYSQILYERHVLIRHPFRTTTIIIGFPSSLLFFPTTVMPYSTGIMIALRYRAQCTA
ncbi:MAG: hypothetical protein LBH06_08855 [Rikenellaceae bacterium]|nr:hypothetical protein [Rikenellaceae bacterium]